jgi:hypothetical protein
VRQHEGERIRQRHGTPSARRTAASLDLHVECVVFDGVPPLQHDALATAIGHALVRALGQHGTAGDPAPPEETGPQTARQNGAADLGGRIGGTVAPAVLAAVGSIGGQSRR